MTETMSADLLRFAKTRAKRLRNYLSGQNHNISHSTSLEAIAQTEGFRDWNTYVARFKLAEHTLLAPGDHEPRYFPLQVGEAISGLYRGAAFEGHLIGLEQTITPDVWRAKLHFTEAVALPSSEKLKLTRQRVRCMLNSHGKSVNLKGKPDGAVVVEIKQGT